DLVVDVLGRGQHRHGRRRSVDAALGLGLGHALDAVGAALELEHRVGALAFDLERVLALADLQRFGLEAQALRVAGEHPVEVAGPEPGLLATGAALDFDDHALLVVRVALDHRKADLLLELLDQRARLLELLAHPRLLPHLLDQLLGAGRVVLRAPPFRGQLRRRLELAIGAADLGVALAVGDHLGVGHLLAELGEAALDLRDEVFDHGVPSVPAPQAGAAARAPGQAAAWSRAAVSRRAGAPASSASSSSNACNASRVSLSLGSPFSASASSAWPIGSSLSMTRAPVEPSTLRVSACAQTAPKRPVLEPITAAGLLARGLLARGRETQSSAFLSTPGIEELYSGVAIRRPSASAIASLRCRTGSGGVASSSSLNGGIASSRSKTTSSTPSGSSLPAPRRSLVLWEPSRRLPDSPRIFMAARPPSRARG